MVTIFQENNMFLSKSQINNEVKPTPLIEIKTSRPTRLASLKSMTYL